jgi:uncharacterized protein
VSSPYRVPVADFRNQPGARRHEHVVAPLDGLAISASRVPEHADVDLDVTLEAVHEGILATGTVVAPWAGECRRCLGPVSGQLDASFRELFEEAPTEGESYPLVHEQVDLEPLVREVVLLELPQAPLCREDCRGLCPRCGADLNEGPCECPPDDIDPRWAALDALRTDENTRDD